MFFPWQDLSASRRLTSCSERGGGFSTACVTMCVCVCVCARVGGRRLLSWLMDWTAVSYWAERTGMVTQRNAAEEGFAGRMTWGENSRKARKWISTNQQQQRQQTHTHTGRRDVRRQDARRSSVFTLSTLSVSASSSRFYLWHSWQCLNDSPLSEVLRTSLCSRRRWGGLRIWQQILLNHPRHHHHRHHQQHYRRSR